MHVPWALKALEAGKHVLCEKPIALSAAEAEQLVTAQARSGRFVEEAFPFPNHPQWDFIRQTAASGEIGRVRAVTAVSAYQNPNPADLRNQPAMGGGGLYDLGCYLINGCRIVFREEPARVVGLFDMDPLLGVDRLTSAILEFPSGHATITVSTQAGPTTGGTHQHLGVLGEHGWMRAEFPFSHSTPTACRVFLGDTHARGGIPTREVAFPVANQYALQAERFSRRVRGEAVEAWPIEHAVANMRVIDALFRSQRNGGWETV
jgi:predicted dehydrogenase